MANVLSLIGLLANKKQSSLGVDMKLTEQQVKDFFITCKNDAKDGIFHGEYPDVLDLMEFANKVADHVSKEVESKAKREEHKRLVELTEKINPVVSKFLLDKKEYAE